MAARRICGAVHSRHVARSCLCLPACSPRARGICATLSCSHARAGNENTQRVGHVSGSAKRAGFWLDNPSGKSPQALCPPDPMNHVKMFKGRPRRDAFFYWYTANTKHFHHWHTSVVLWKSKTHLGWVINPVLHYLVRRIRFWRIKSLEQDFKNLYYSSIPGNRNWQIETADWNLNVCLDIWVKKRNSMHA